MKAHVLVGMSALEVAEHDRLAAAARRVDGTVGHLQIGDPSLSTELTRLADAGATTISLAGVSLGPTAPAQSWLRRVAGHWWRERDGVRPEVRVATSVLRNDLDALDGDALRDVLGLARPVTGAEAALDSPAWEDVPGHRHQVLVCRGPRCTAAGSDRTMAALDRALGDRSLGDDDVLVTVTGCQFPCNHAPVVSVQPDDVWYGRVVPDAVDEIVTHHLVGGTPVASRRLDRTRGRTLSTPDLPTAQPIADTEDPS
ncbi:(2Fe-2S) ferredoxin domain-containing protein [Nocardioides hwasunensis]|uniref:(2Fe-2S) ferredoxin domain-containing protein n=1 Tax=Nocardioides hwasunensis TaxID=397258 RepID=A0ABR8MLP0_9ACTN|nr:(2Fe-2S) ferredoxin domain-containing protein [Nocardioides hwasunensis]MBD3916931.1 (2Fe-2S) ferredoxin domain-containing protein [Nocardioides hwasunensis]